MRKNLLNLICCPVDLGDLELRSASTEESDGHILEGTLVCRQCEAVYSIRDGVPNLLPGEQASVEDDLLEHKNKTQERFGYEWLHYHRWGWIESLPEEPNAEVRYRGGLREHTTDAFWSKSLFDESHLKPGLRVLDGGCGNGRFSHEAALSGAEVVGIDLGPGCDAAFANTREQPNIHIVRGDLFRLPFRDASFDCVFSIGVLMHTGDAERAFDSLARTVRDDGLIVAHVYGKGLATYEVVDNLSRQVTTRLSIKTQMRLARMWAGFGYWLQTGGRLRRWLYRVLGRHVMLLPTDHHMFDWYAAPIATHHTLPEVVEWFSKRGLSVERTKPDTDDAPTLKRWRRSHRSITVLGRRGQVDTSDESSMSTPALSHVAS